APIAARCSGRKRSIGAKWMNIATARSRAVSSRYERTIVTIAARGDWIPSSAGPLNFLKFGGFYVKDDPDNYFYGKF
ncbi:MAG: hypothetical protein ACTHLD_02140, partial [Chitinophaga sp.]